MDVTKETLEGLSRKALELKYGETGGKAISFLLFGQYGLLGLADIEQIVKTVNDKKNDNPSKTLTDEMLSELIMDVFTDLMQIVLNKAGIKVLENIANPLLILKIVFSPVQLGNGELPQELRDKVSDNSNKENSNRGSREPGDSRLAEGAQHGRSGGESKANDGAQDRQGGQDRQRGNGDNQQRDIPMPKA